MNDKTCLLSIDVGTQSTKAMLIDLRGEIRAIEKRAYPPYVSEKPGWAEQDPEIFWSALCTVTRALMANDLVDVNNIAGVALTTQRGSVVNIDESGQALRPAMLWLDQRRTTGIPKIGGAWGVGFRLKGVEDIIAYIQAEAEANWIAKHQPEIWKRTHKYLLISGFLNFKLTGRFADSVGSQVAYIPFNYKKQEWAKDSDWRWKVAPFSRNMFSELVPTGQILGHIESKAAELTGIPEGLPVVAAAADKACEVIGSGGLTPDVGCLSFGTTATVNCTSNTYLEAIPHMPAYPSAAPGRYSVEVKTDRGFWMVSWFKEQFGHLEQMDAVDGDRSPEELLDNLAATVPPGSMGLVLQPFWSPGLRDPGPEAKGAVIGFGDVHTRAHMYRALLEGLTFSLRQGTQKIEKVTGVPIRRLRISGGGAQSRTAMEIAADVFGIPAERPHVYETSGLGAAIVASAGLKLHPSIERAVEEMTRVGERFEPNHKNHQLYDALFNRVYEKMYAALRPIYQEIREITGYPAWD